MENPVFVSHLCLLTAIECGWETYFEIFVFKFLVLAKNLCNHWLALYVCYMFHGAVKWTTVAHICCILNIIFLTYHDIYRSKMLLFFFVQGSAFVIFPVQTVTTVDSKVVQLGYQDGRLLVSSLSRCYLCDTERWVPAWLPLWYTVLGGMTL